MGAKPFLGLTTFLLSRQFASALILGILGFSFVIGAVSAWQPTSADTSGDRNNRLTQIVLAKLQARSGAPSLSTQGPYQICFLVYPEGGLLGFSGNYYNNSTGWQCDYYTAGTYTAWAISPFGYSFSRWVADNMTLSNETTLPNFPWREVSWDNPVKVTVNETGDMWAVFNRIPGYYKISFTYPLACAPHCGCAPWGSCGFYGTGNITLSSDNRNFGHFRYGDYVVVPEGSYNVTATPDPGYHFVGWFSPGSAITFPNSGPGSSDVSLANPTTILVTGDSDLLIQFGSGVPTISPVAVFLLALMLAPIDYLRRMNRRIPKRGPQR